MKRLFVILLCKLLYKLNVSVAINVSSPRGEIITNETKIAIAIKCQARQFQEWNYGRYLTALCDEDSDCTRCDIKEICKYSKERK